MAVSENYGDIIYTYEFERFKQAMGFSVYLCRKSDPESKGKVEAVVKYMKRNFAAHRLFGDIKSWNQSFLIGLNGPGTTTPTEPQKATGRSILRRAEIPKAGTNNKYY